MRSSLRIGSKFSCNRDNTRLILHRNDPIWGQSKTTSQVTTEHNPAGSNSGANSRRCKHATTQEPIEIPDNPTSAVNPVPTQQEHPIQIPDESNAAGPVSGNPDTTQPENSESKNVGQEQQSGNSVPTQRILSLEEIAQQAEANETLDIDMEQVNLDINTTVSALNLPGFGGNSSWPPPPGSS